MVCMAQKGEKLMLTRYMHSLRLYPHLQNTGGFFVALLEKAAKPERGVNGSAAIASADVVGIADDVPSAR